MPGAPATSRHKNASKRKVSKAAAGTNTSHAAEKKPGSTYQFITFSDPSGMRDDRAISQIRRHAMKEIGESRRLPKPPRRVQKVRLAPRVEEDSWKEEEDEREAPQLSCQRIGSSGIDPFCHFPVTLTETSKVLVMNIFGDCLKAYRNEWFSMSIAHASTFNSLLSCSALFLGGAQYPDRPLRENPTALYFYQIAVSETREELDRVEDGISDGLIGTVLGLYAFTKHIDDRVQSQIQRRGLLALLKRRGLSSIAKNRELRNTLSWVDLRSAYTRDTAPDIPIPDLWLDETERNFGHDGLTVRNAAQDFSEGPDETFARSIFRIYRRLRVATSEIRKHVETPGSPKVDLPTHLMVLVHELLSNQPASESKTKAGPTILALDAWRIGMLLFLAPAYRYFGVHPIYMDHLVQKVYRLRMLWSMWSQWDQKSRALLTWTLFMTALEAGESGQRAVRKWCVRVSADIAKEFVGPSDGAGLLLTARSVIWIPELLDGRAEELVKEIDEVIACGGGKR